MKEREEYYLILVKNTKLAWFFIEHGVNYVNDVNFISGRF